MFGALPPKQRSYLVILIALVVLFLWMIIHRGIQESKDSVSKSNPVSPSASKVISDNATSRYIENTENGQQLDGNGHGEQVPVDAADPSSKQGDKLNVEFQLLENEVLKSIPSVVDLQRLSENDVHFTPVSLRIAGRELGRIAKAIDMNSQLIHRGIEFFKRCALRESYPDTIRALCLADARDYLKKAGSGLEAFPEASTIPDAIRNLAEKI